MNKNINERKIEKKFVVGEEITEVVSFDGQGAIFTRKQIVPVSDLAKLLGMKLPLENQSSDRIIPLLVADVVVPGRYGGKFDGARPVLNVSELINNGIEITENTKEVYYGNFPQTIVRNEELSDLLEERYLNKNLWKTGKEYTLPSGDNSINYRKLTEYEYQGKRYVRVTSQYPLKTLNNEKTVYWVEVEPIKWEITGERAITSNILLSDLCYCMAHAYMEEFKKDIISKTISRKDKLSELIKERNKINELIEELEKGQEKTRKL